MRIKYPLVSVFLGVTSVVLFATQIFFPANWLVVVGLGICSFLSVVWFMFMTQVKQMANFSFVLNELLLAWIIGFVVGLLRFYPVASLIFTFIGMWPTVINLWYKYYASWLDV